MKEKEAKTGIKEKMEKYKGGKLEDEWEKPEPEPEDEIQAMLGAMNKTEKEAKGTPDIPPETINEKKLKEKDEKIKMFRARLRKMNDCIKERDDYIGDLREDIEERNVIYNDQNSTIDDLRKQLNLKDKGIDSLKELKKDTERELNKKKKENIALKAGSAGLALVLAIALIALKKK